MLDKSTGETSNTAMQRVRKLFQARKAGHTGSLDPLATGLLPVCFGEATKLSGYLLGSDKGYRVLIRLGVTTTTGDIDGELVARKPVPALTRESVLQLLASFCGHQTQVPPMYSALKHNGQRLYELARLGHVVERTPRFVEISALDLLACTDETLELSVGCSKGTYIRSLAEDIGAKLGCGAHVEQLQRIRVGTITLDQGIDFNALAAMSDEQRLGTLWPMDKIVADLPVISLEDDLAVRLCYGQTVRVFDAPIEGLCRLYHQEQFLGIGEAKGEGLVAPKRLFRSDLAA